MIDNQELQKIMLEYQNSNEEIKRAVDIIHERSGKGVNIDEILKVILYISSRTHLGIEDVIKMYIIDRNNLEFKKGPESFLGHILYVDRWNSKFMSIPCTFNDEAKDHFLNSIYAQYYKMIC